MQAVEQKQRIIQCVPEHGGPCASARDVKKIMRSNLAFYAQSTITVTSGQNLWGRPELSASFCLPWRQKSVIRRLCLGWVEASDWLGQGYSYSKAWWLILVTRQLLKVILHLTVTPLLHSQLTVPENGREFLPRVTPTVCRIEVFRQWLGQADTGWASSSPFSPKQQMQWVRGFMTTATYHWQELPQFFVAANTSFVATKVCLPWQNSFAATKVFVMTSILLSRQKCVCRDKTFVKNTFVMTKDVFCHDKNDTCGSSRQW